MKKARIDKEINLQIVEKLDIPVKSTDSTIQRIRKEAVKRLLEE